MSDYHPDQFLKRSRKRAQPAVRRRFGLLDLAIVVVALIAAFSRTPVGGLAHRAWYEVRGIDAELPALTSYFATGAPGVSEDLTELVARADLPIEPLPEGALPEPYRTAARVVAANGLPPAVRGRLTMYEGDDAERLVAALDAAYTDDPEAAIEAVAIGPELRDRAVARARATGIEDPESYAAHRRFLPSSSALHADALVNGTMALATALDLTWPIAGPHRITSPWGVRTHPTLHTKKFHNGVDLAVPIGTPVLAAQKGKARVGEDAASGKFVVLDHGHGIRTSYCHLDAHDVPGGADVPRGMQIGLSGNTGRSTGPHLHFVVRVGRKTIDPMKLRRQPVDEVVEAVGGATEGS